ncbi:MAG: FMN-dependent NADH-azoreductase [Burkholderiales bacterium RIFCSPHIGHO2_12_FULL_61_11]|nr:MAG: FMN-dependent NADH-azoreductase [Burkholderiales bacterium RIFCSPHIGHO2_12_FULL_61_11]
MSKLLHIDSSILGGNSVSRQLTAQIVAAWRASHPATTEVSYLDLAVDTPSHLSAESLSFSLPAGAAGLNATQKRENAISEALVAQFLASDVLVIGAPLYNFAIPSQLKAWIDRIAQVGRTFTYTDKGPVGLAGGKTVIIASARGGVYSTSDAGNAMEHQESYLKTVFGFFGVTDVRFVRAEGLAMGEEVKAAALAAAQVDITIQTQIAANQPQSVLAA